MCTEWAKSRYTKVVCYTIHYVSTFGPLCIFGHLYAYIQGSPVEIQFPSHWHVFDRSMTARPPVLSPSRILPQSLSHFFFHFLKEKSDACLKNGDFLFFF